jgi:aldose 1-epimerase
MTALQAAPFGLTPDGAPATVFTLENDRLRVRVTDYGGRMVSIEAPDRRGRREHVLLGFDDIGAFIANGGSFGALLGRYANRINGASFDLDGQAFPLVRTGGNLTLHGGLVGFAKLFWTVARASAEPVPTLVLSHVSADGDQGFPGELSATAAYALDGDTLALSFEAVTTRPTVVNLSAHPYFNLAGAANADVLGHEMSVPADAFLPTDGAQCPTGEIRPVAGTPFDFRTPRLVGSRIRVSDPQLYPGLGYDHCFVLGTAASAAPRMAVRLRDPDSGRVLEIFTDQPGLQVYTGGKLTGSFAGHGGAIYRQAAGLALEAQDFPDAPNQAGFPSTVLRPGEVYRRVIRYRFGTG